MNFHYSILLHLDVCWGKLRFQFDGRAKEGSLQLPVNHVEEEKFHSFPPDFYLEYWWNSTLIPLHEKIFSVRILFQKNNFHFHPFILRKLKEKRFPLNRNDDSINFLYHFSFSSMSVDQTPNRLWIYALLDHFLLHSNNHPERVLNVIQQQIQEIRQQFKINPISLIA